MGKDRHESKETWILISLQSESQFPACKMKLPQSFRHYKSMKALQIPKAIITTLFGEESTGRRVRANQVVRKIQKKTTAL